ncbi:alpha-1,2-fucosyltransferase [Dinghuibacter silviterrae]|uniref:Glycosyl transferase family 11 n=1 Tax=Dinghuibacter silviterrae TaxID=1539049 RepID=A0A4R8DRM0_9BACT|nr:alpha-1,2-fucosyltransferase [Dinghuibacter silviterrae]TDX00065.1 glycosyl transferase family 11 [Dinghuibacter silviterrae]
MDVVVLFNGLGNQMSQYAFYLQKRRTEDSSKILLFCSDHNGFELTKVFDVDLRGTKSPRRIYALFRILLTEKIGWITRPLGRILNRMGMEIVKENFDYSFKHEFLIPSRGVRFYYGGWHSEQYFPEVREEIKKAFTFKVPTDPDNGEYIQDIGEGNSVSIHIRRGDYLSPANLKLFGEVCTLDYYEKAIDRIKGSVRSPRFFIFSNDADWVRENLPVENATYVTGNAGGESWKDMYLMSICKHNIIANSTFSWWAAWLNENPEKIVISPGRFLNSDTTSDVYPDSWIRLNDY